MKELKLPIFRGAASEPKVLSMDEYLAFIQFNLKHAFDKKSYAKWKRLLAVNVPFVLR